MVNECTFIGRLGADPKVGTLEGGVKYATFNIACDEREYTKKDGTVVPKRTEWIPIVLWRGLAETAEKYLRKGDLVHIRGRYHTTESEKDGVKSWRTSIMADTMNMLSSRREEAPKPVNPDTAPAASPQPVFTPEEKDDLAF